MLDGGILTEGKAITEETGIKLEGVRLEDLGRAKRVTVDQDNTTLVDGAGGGALLRASKALEKLKMPGDEQIGVDTVRRACEDPVRQIVVNSGTEGKIVVEKIRENNNPNFGFNATETQVQDRQAFHAVA